MSEQGLQRTPRRENAAMLPRELEEGLFEVDATWGKVQPIELAPGVRTVGELELIAHVERGLPLVDTRPPDFFERATIPGAVNVPHEEILERRGELDESVASVFFCNGPQCLATPEAIEKLLGAGYPPAAILYYRGGMHDWMTLGYPSAPDDGDVRS